MTTVATDPSPAIARTPTGLGHQPAALEEVPLDAVQSNSGSQYLPNPEDPMDTSDPENPEGDSKSSQVPADVSDTTQNQGQSEEEPQGIEAWLRYEATSDYRTHSTWVTASQQGWGGRCKWFGYKVADGMDAVGGFFASLFGITSSRYQYVLDARDRMIREEERAMRAERERIERGEAGLAGSEDPAGLYRDEVMVTPTRSTSPQHTAEAQISQTTQAAEATNSAQDEL